jgi:hypothetical protein
LLRLRAAFHRLSTFDFGLWSIKWAAMRFQQPNSVLETVRQSGRGGAEPERSCDRSLEFKTNILI